MTVLDNTDGIQPRAVTTKVAAAMLSIPEQAVRRLIRRGQLRARSMGRSYIVSIAAIDEYLAGADNPIQHPDSLRRTA